jgi:hypothetical protein
MREIPARVQTLLESGESIEPIMLIGIFWRPDHETFYADKTLKKPIEGRIIDFGSLETVARLDGAGSSTELSFTLNDFDGAIKKHIDTKDVTTCQVKVYQLFNDANIQDKVMLFEGHIATPIEWDEGTRNIKLTAITKKLTRDVGFAIDDSTATIFHQDLIGKAWPAIFGSPKYTPTLPLNEVPTGTITTAFGVPDKDLNQGRIDSVTSEREALNDLYITQGVFAAEESGFDPATGLHYSTDEDFNTAQEAAIAWTQAMEQKIASYDAQIEVEKTNLDDMQKKFNKHNFVIGGYRFPQGVPLICKINERLFQVRFYGGGAPSNPEEACPVELSLHGIPLEYKKGQSQDDTDSFFQAGSRIELVSDLPGGYHYVASITPGVVAGVYAYRTFNGVRQLARVPTFLYTVSTQTLTSGLEATHIVLKHPLSAITFRENSQIVQRDDFFDRIDNGPNKVNPGFLNNEVDWENDLYVNFAAFVGPNPVDIMTWIISHFTKYAWDLTSFASTFNSLENYPANFCLTEMMSADKLLQDIAFQSRCAIWLKNGRYYLKYLPKEHDATSIISAHDIVTKSFRVGCTSTDEVITKINAKWRPDYIQPERTAIIRMNEEKYGTIEEEQSYYIYSQYSQVIKSATFWLIRRSNVWKTITCDLFVHKIDIETLDDVTLNLTDNYVANTPVDCQVESADYNSSENTISVTLWVPVRLGEMEIYPWARPADLPARQIIPLFNPVTVGANVILPKFNGLSKAVGVGVASFDQDPSFERLGYVQTKQSGIPASKGDRMPSDRGDNFFTDPGVTGTYNYAIPYRRIAVPKIQPENLTEQPADKKKKLISICPGRVISGTGKNWSLEIFPDGIKSKGITITAAETHQSVNLVGIEGTWVTCFRLVDKEGKLTYSFISENYAAFPVRMENTTTGRVYPHGSSKPSFEFPVHQLFMSKDDFIPEDTWGIVARIWNGSAYIYEVQIPIWLK